jgi:hypothetical protein
LTRKLFSVVTICGLRGGCQGLRTRQNQISRLVGMFPGLVRLQLRADVSQLDELVYLRHLPRLRSLSWKDLPGHTGLEGFTPFTGCSNLTHLALAGITLSSARGLGALPHLQSLQLQVSLFCRGEASWVDCGWLLFVCGIFCLVACMQHTQFWMRLWAVPEFAPFKWIQVRVVKDDKGFFLGGGGGKLWEYGMGLAKELQKLG